MKYHLRCRYCEARQTRDRHPDEYILGPVCRKCGRRGTLRVDKWAQSRPWRKTVCRCGGYHFPHRRGSKYCEYRVDGTKRVRGDSDYMDRFDEYLINKYGE